MEPIDKLYAKFGRAQDLIENQKASYASILKLAASLVSGEIDPKRVIIDLTNGGWSIVPEGQRPAMPATINGLPVCVIAPAESEADKLRATIAATEAEVVTLREANERLKTALAGFAPPVVPNPVPDDTFVPFDLQSVPAA